MGQIAWTEYDGNGNEIASGTYPTSATYDNAQAVAAAVATHLAQVEAWLAANPNGAVLTAAQTAFLARMLVGLGRLQLQLLGTVGQAT